MDKRIRIREAIAHAKHNGKKIVRRKLATKMFLNTTEHSAYTCFNNYETGRTTKLDRRQVSVLCRELGVDANFLFGIPPMSNQNDNENG